MRGKPPPQGIPGRRPGFPGPGLTCAPHGYPLLAVPGFVSANCFAEPDGTVFPIMTAFGNIR